MGSNESDFFSYFLPPDYPRIVVHESFLYMHKRLIHTAPFTADPTPTKRPDERHLQYWFALRNRFGDVAAWCGSFNTAVLLGDKWNDEAAEAIMTEGTGAQSS